MAHVSSISLLRAAGVSRQYGDRRVLTDVDLLVDGTHVTGLIGENGAGKSTLLRILAGTETPDRGIVHRPIRTGYLPQDVGLPPERTVAELIDDALGEVHAIERELEAASSALAGGAGDAAVERYVRALDDAERAEVWSTTARRDELIGGLGVDDIPLSTRLGDVSGGQRSRFALVALLLRRPDALVLDEPTNHLDDDAVEFLAGRLLVWRGPVLFASHDRAFLDEVAGVVVDIDPSRSGAIRYRGGYSDYLAEKAAERARWDAQFASEQDELRALRDAVEVTSRRVAPNRAARDNDRMGYDFKTGRIDKQISRRVRNARERLDTLTDEQVSRPPAVLRFTGIPRGSHALLDDDAVLRAHAATVNGRMRAVDLTVAPDARLLVTGPNGAGKSTLLAALAGRVRLDSGAIASRTGLRVALLEQDVRFADPARSPRSIYDETVGQRRADAVPLTSLGLVGRRDADRPTGELSGGQQRRLALALIIARPPHVFLLDEPTNHLSLTLATDLEEALGTYPGAVVVATHDRWLRRRFDGDELRMSTGGGELHRLPERRP